MRVDRGDAHGGRDQVVRHDERQRDELGPRRALRDGNRPERGFGWWRGRGERERALAAEKHRRRRTVIAYAPRRDGVLLEARVLQWSHAPASVDGTVRFDLERAAVLPLQAVEHEAPAVLSRRFARRVARPGQAGHRDQLDSTCARCRGSYLCVIVSETDSDAAIRLAAEMKSSQVGNTAHAHLVSAVWLLQWKTSSHECPEAAGMSSGTAAVAPWRPGRGMEH